MHTILDISSAAALGVIVFICYHDDYHHNSCNSLNASICQTLLDILCVLFHLKFITEGAKDC